MRPLTTSRRWEEQFLTVLTKSKKSFLRYDTYLHGSSSLAVQSPTLHMRDGTASLHSRCSSSCSSSNNSSFDFQVVGALTSRSKAQKRACSSSREQESESASSQLDKQQGGLLWKTKSLACHMSHMVSSRTSLTRHTEPKSDHTRNVESRH